MTARRVALAALTTSLVASGAYVFVYLYRWEWNRALVAGVIFLAAELALVGGLLANRLARIEQHASARANQQEALLHVIRGSRPPARVTFDWLMPPDRMNVFVPVLLGAGLLMSAVAWLLERIARLGVVPVAGQHLAHRLGSLALPARGFLVDVDDELALLQGPVTDLPDS